MPKTRIPPHLEEKFRRMASKENAKRTYEALLRYGWRRPYFTKGRKPDVKGYESEPDYAEVKAYADFTNQPITNFFPTFAEVQDERKSKFPTARWEQERRYREEGKPIENNWWGGTYPRRPSVASNISLSSGILPDDERRLLAIQQGQKERFQDQPQEVILDLPDDEIAKFDELRDQARELKIHPLMFEERGGITPESFTQRDLIEAVRKHAKSLGVSPRLYTESVAKVGFNPIDFDQWIRQGKKVRSVTPISQPKAAATGAGAGGGEPLPAEGAGAGGAGRLPTIPEEGRADDSLKIGGKFPSFDPQTMSANIANLPKWQSDIIKYALVNQTRLANRSYPIYPGERSAPRSSATLGAEDMLKRYLEKSPFKDEFDQAKRIATDATADNIGARLAPRFESASSPSVDRVGRYMSPYEENVIAKMYERGAENFKEKVLQPLEGSLIAKGQHFSSKRPELIGKSLKDFMRSLQDKEAQLRDTGYRHALSAAQQDQVRELQSAFSEGNVRARDKLAQLQAAGQLHGLSSREEAQKLMQSDVLRQMGMSAEARDQARLDRSYDDFWRQWRFPAEQNAEVLGQAVGQPYPWGRFQVSGSPRAREAVTHPLNSAAGMAVALGGHLFNLGQAPQQQYAEGGPVQPQISPEEQAWRDDTQKMIAQMGRQKNPLADFLINFGQSYASNPAVGFSKKLGPAAGAGIQGLKEANAYNDQRRLQALAFRNKYLQSVMTMAEQRKQREFQNKRWEREFGLKEREMSERKLRYQEEAKRKERELDLQNEWKRTEQKIKENAAMAKSLPKPEEQFKGEQILQGIQTAQDLLNKKSISGAGSWNLPIWGASARAELDVSLKSLSKLTGLPAPSPEASEEFIKNWIEEAQDLLIKKANYLRVQDSDSDIHAKLQRLDEINKELGIGDE